MKKWMSWFLPNSKKASLILAVLVFVFLGTVVFSYLRKKPTSPAKTKVPILTENQLQKLNQDSDSDGLKDWEETIFRTDPKNSDTDGDGTKDGDEIIEGRDPTLPGPKDLVIPKSKTSQASIEASVNYTKDFTERFLKGPIAQIVTGQKPDINTALVEAYTERLLSQSILSEAPKILDSEIRLSKDTSLASMRTYLESFQTIFQNLSARGKNELDVTVSAFQNQEYGGLQDLGKYVEAYQKTIDQMRALYVPLPLKGFHLTVLNYLSQFKLSTVVMQNAENDPIGAMLAIKERLKLNDEFTAYLKFSQEKIISLVR